MSQDYYIVEQPLGVITSDSKLEKLWRNYPGRYSIHTERIIQLDPYANISRNPIRYALSHFELCEDVPDDEWISTKLSEFIRDEISSSGYDTPSTFFPECSTEMEIDDVFLWEFMKQSEWENLVTVELPKNNSDEAMAESIYKLLCHPKIGSSKNSSNIDKDAFVKRIVPFIQKQKRLSFILPSFPFKDQNRFRVPYDADTVDFSEVAFLMRLHNVIQSLYQVHPFGADAVILSDGRLYKDIFKIESEKVEEYQWRLKYYRNKLNIAGDISIIDLKELIDRADEDGVVTRILEHIENRIRSSCTSKEEFLNLVQGMKWNMNSRKLLAEVTDEEAWNIIKREKSYVSEKLQPVWVKFNELAEEAAIKYASVNLMLKWTNLLLLFFPEAIRCTVHPKKGQVALAMNYAWNGIAWSEKWPKSFQDINSIPYYQLAKYSAVKKVILKGENYPCFFTTGQYNQNLDAAKHVLPSNGWIYDEFFGREFNIYDRDGFVELGKGDPYFNWERKLQSSEYYTSLLQFRIAHYKKYGFGVHAIFYKGKLIGQMGLQVLNEKHDEIEYVIFLGQNYVHKGLGRKLLDYLFARCREEGIKQIYGIIRSDNEAARNSIKKYKPKQIRTMSHYHQKGILYGIKL